jgi:hypothetical protein
VAICTLCNQEMLDAASCVDEPLALVDGDYAHIRFGDEGPDWGGGRCGDCEVLPGGIHHPGCEFEKCPRCGGQLIGCDCLPGPD